ncbi:hypothetical protein ACSYHF_12605 [Stenotrophomonas maltophilia group sp. P373]|uniref:hypothetical protein n=1 Tax=Stenotrophomonas TaxID=40323 RepID=UPI000DA8D89F|nr:MULTISPECIES: hypothetical protein [Stenotrophomonas]AYA91180.1 hypothetical protein PEM_10660 [Stenotrophomonas sp. Pemsol]MCU1006098.1 hypothetical protein [Stenotrophomonas maltophilia]PZS98940.1 hypothetical protein A7X90_04225 [Stenotrophomonas maltophilia]PZT22174.1 hypothetical protein A7X86_05125 [Stenotrophomonas maltophilia]PZT42895.1 hypothetical protein A7X99_01330 [Stenotrophomonas maltophilia]
MNGVAKSVDLSFADDVEVAEALMLSMFDREVRSGDAIVDLTAALRDRVSLLRLKAERFQGAHSEG